MPEQKQQQESNPLVKDLTSEKQGRYSTVQDRSGKSLTKEQGILRSWTNIAQSCTTMRVVVTTQYWTAVSPPPPNNAVLDCSQPPPPPPPPPEEEHLQPILREEVEIAVASFKKGKSAGVDNIPAELVHAGGETMIDVLTEICNMIWRTGEWATPWTQSLIITLHKRATYNSARTSEVSASSVIRAKSC